MSETCCGQISLARYAFIPTPSINDHSELRSIAGDALFSNYLAQKDLAISNQPVTVTPLRQLDSIEQEILHEAHMRSVKVIGGVIRA